MRQYLLHILSVTCVALGIQHALCVSRITLSSVACPSVLHLPTFSHKRYDFRGGVWGRGESYRTKMSVLILSSNYVWHIFRSKQNSARYYHKCPKVFKLSTLYSFQISSTP